MPVNQLADVINEGLVPDIFKMERAYDLLMAIGENVSVLNSREAGNFGELFGAFQIALETEAILAVSRVYDKPDDQYPTRCIQRALDLLERHSKGMPEIIEMDNTRLACQFMGEGNAVLVALEQGKEEFISSLVQYYRKLLASDEVTTQIKLLKNIRDKRLAHNESAEPLGPTWGALQSFATHAQNFVGILGWAFFNTAYIQDGKYFLSEGAKRPSLALARLSKQLKCR